MKAPFPYMGGKSRHAARIWEELGDPDVYAEPFAGTLAVLLARPHEPRREIVCDKDANIVNFWRALRAAPDQVAAWADAPTYQQECNARHAWIQETNEQRRTAVSADPDYYDVRAAGYWVHGVSSAIGTGYGTEYGRKTPIPALRAGMGVTVQRKNTPYGSLIEWFDALAERLRKVLVLSHNWKATVSPVALKQTKLDGPNFPTVGVFLDPPYRSDTGRERIYSGDAEATEVAAAAYEWALEHGNKYRIAYAMNVDDFPVPDGWTYQDWPKHLRSRPYDRIIFSPACAGGRQLGLFQ